MTPGVKTSEFGVTAFVNIAAAIIGILAARGLLTADEGELWLVLIQAIAVAVAPLVMAITASVYTNSRRDIKTAVIESESARQVATIEAESAQIIEAAKS